jgi:anaerobic magnesium-protoporphyrin IX monomethyl ester cyclase
VSGAALLYPPFMDPRAPQLGLPSLAAFLRKNGTQVSMRDLALEALLYLAEAEPLATCREALVALSRKARSASELLDPFDRAAELAPWALSRLRDPEAFYDSRDFNAARDVVACIVRAAGEATGGRVRLSLEPIVYEASGIHQGRFADLLRATERETADPFDAFYASRTIPELEAEAPALVGISLTNHQQWLAGLSLARRLKRRGFHVVLGGALVSKFVDALERLPEFFDVFADGVVAYEGETALAELLEELAGKRRFEKVPNFVFRDGSSVRVNTTRFEDVNALPTPDFDGLPLGRYLAPAPVLPVLTGKGCYFNRCKFCEIPYINHVSPKPYRIRSPELVVGDVRTLAAKHGAKHFVITDEALSPRLLLKLSEAFRPFSTEERHFTGYARLEDGFTRDVFDQVAELGIRKLYFGMESASQAMIDHMDKGTRSSSTAGILRSCRDTGIRFHVFSIIGLPEETEAMARETYRFFIDHREILDTPGNSFGIRRFQLERHTDYFKDRDRYGIHVESGALTPEFLVGLSPSEWENTRGLGPAEVDRLLDREFNPGLVQTFKQTYGRRFQTWPVGEEYAVLYGGRYGRERDSAFRAALPDRAPGTKVTLRLNPAVAKREDGDYVSLALAGEHLLISRALLDSVVHEAPRALDDLLGGVPESTPEEAGAGIDAMIGAGFLQLRVELPRQPLRRRLPLFAGKAAAATTEPTTDMVAEPRRRVLPLAPR